MVAQVDLPLEHASQAVDLDYLTRSKKTVGQVVTYQAELGGLDPKQVYLSLEMQKSVFSGIASDQRSFPIRGECEDYRKFRELSGNDALLYWLCHISGYDPRSLRKYRSDVEAELERERSLRLDAEAKLATITEFMREVKG